MHEAFRLGAIAEKLPLKIECLETYGTRRRPKRLAETVPLTAPPLSASSAAVSAQPTAPSCWWLRLKACC